MNEQIKAFVEKVDGKMVAIASDETMDRHGDSLKVDLWDLKNYKKNPVLQFAHDYSQPPVGIAKNIRKEDGKLLFEPVFHSFTQLARDVGTLYDEGIMNAFSVGFIPHADEQGNAKSLELLEISAVPVPANPAAVVLEKSMKLEVKAEEKQQIDEWLKEEVEEYQIIDATPEGLEKAGFEIIKSVEQFENRADKNDAITVCMTEFINLLVEQKQGRVLSKKNRGAVEDAVSALNEVLTADSMQDAEKEKPAAAAPKTIKNDGPDKTKGRFQPVSLDRETVEAIKNQLGFISRKLIKR